MYAFKDKFAAQPTFVKFHVFNENLLGIERRRACVKLNRPIRVGFTILELAKKHMYEFHYDQIPQVRTYT